MAALPFQTHANYGTWSIDVGCISLPEKEGDNFGIGCIYTIHFKFEKIYRVEVDVKKFCVLYFVAFISMFFSLVLSLRGVCRIFFNICQSLGPFHRIPAPSKKACSWLIEAVFKDFYRLRLPPNRFNGSGSL